MSDFVPYFYSFVYDNFDLSVSDLLSLDDLRFYFLFKLYTDVCVMREILSSDFYDSFSRDFFDFGVKG